MAGTLQFADSLGVTPTTGHLFHKRISIVSQPPLVRDFVPEDEKMIFVSLDKIRGEVSALQEHNEMLQDEYITLQTRLDQVLHTVKQQRRGMQKSEEENTLLQIRMASQTSQGSATSSKLEPGQSMFCALGVANASLTQTQDTRT